MSTSSKTNLTPEDTVSDIDQVITISDGVRKLGLDQAKLLQSAKTDALTREKTRLAAELGENHPRVKTLTNRLAFEAGRKTVLQSERQKLDLPVQEAAPTQVLIRGRVLDQNQQPLADLTVALADQKGKWLRAYGYTCTDKQGFFSLSFDAPALSADGTAALAYLLVTDKTQKRLYLDTTALPLAAGQMAYREITLKDVCRPTPPEGEEDVILNPDEWKVVGRVRDAKGRPAAKLTVDVYDKDLLFDDRLGTATTDDKGEFVLTYRTEKFRDLIECKPDLYLNVKDASGTVLYNSIKAVRFCSGKVEQFDITLPERVTPAPDVKIKTTGETAGAEPKQQSIQVKQAKAKGKTKKNRKPKTGKG